MTDQKKLLFFLPNIFTALNMACGLVAIMNGVKGEYLVACRLILLGAIFDLVDGRLARITGTSSAFGEEFDSLSDVISFGLAPAIIYYYAFLVDYGRLGVVLSFFYLLCGAMRLARFNANLGKTSKSYFQGLPIPTAGIAIAGLILLSLEYPQVKDYKGLIIAHLLTYAVLMITNIPFPSFKHNRSAREGSKIFSIVVAFFILSSMLTYEELMVYIFTFLYTLTSLVYVTLNRKKLSVWDKDDE